jgi:hypothetical protein
MNALWVKYRASDTLLGSTVSYNFLSIYRIILTLNVTDRLRITQKGKAGDAVVQSVLCRKSNNEIRGAVGGNLASYSKAHEFRSRSGCQL